MDLHWKLVSSLTRPGSHLRRVVWAARIDGPGEDTRRWVYRECIYEAGEGGLLAGEDEEEKRLLQTRYGMAADACMNEDLNQVLATASVPC